MAYLGLGLGIGALAAVFALLTGAGFVAVLLAYAGAGFAAMLSALASAMMFEQNPSKIEEDPMLLPYR